MIHRNERPNLALLQTAALALDLVRIFRPMDIEWIT